MTDAAPGWYPDPSPHPGQPTLLRWWDGTRWTEHVHAAAPVTQAAPAVASAYQQPMPTTPDGEPLAGWWRRVGAVLLDGLILVPLLVLLTTPFWHTIGDAYSDWWHDFRHAMDTGQDPPSSMDLQERLGSTLAWIALINIGVNFTYYVVFLSWKRATPGKLILGLRIRLREAPDTLPLGAIVVRWLATFGPYAAAAIVAASLGSTAGAVVVLLSWLGQIYYVLDSVWPLWDGKRQALHDKAARTNVVVRAR